MSKLGSSYSRAPLKQDQSLFNIDTSHYVGRVAKNNGLKKYQNRHLKENIYKNSLRYTFEKTPRE